MSTTLLVLHGVLVLAVSMRVLLRDDLSPDKRMAWLMVLTLLPYVGVVIYYLLGEISLGRRLTGRHQPVATFMRQHWPDHAAVRHVLGKPENIGALVRPQWQGVFRYAASVNGFYPLAGCRAELMADNHDTRERMLADMDAAEREINVLYYIWLGDDMGTDIAHALIRAARRGVVCRAMVDGLGSRALTRTALWRSMQDAGVHLAVALPINNPVKVILTSRIDIRNHRKITVIDGRVTYVGSQNCADAAFLVKARYAPWVDIMVRVEGPAVAQMQLLFASDWVQATGDDDFNPLTQAAVVQPGGFVAQMVGDGPTERRRSTPQLFATLIANAQRELTISTPYFVPDATVMEALCAAAFRGVTVTLIFPKRNDSWIVAAASRSTYHRLLKAGVVIHEFRGGLLHAKTLTTDGDITLIGSSNIDLRSFDLNYENNMLLQDQATTAAIQARQQHYMEQADRVTLEQVTQWPWWRRIWNNVMATLSPVL
ncbi:cardiolipin synthase [Ottowia thiooxydans]|uniref:cardiolipin synthase n=1 Tax=Ottowia thiooxydans TaxID=219182 RepID=UPI00048E1D40